MPMTLEGSCRCGAVRFSVQSHTPVPYQRCYCSICRKTAGGAGYAINIGAVADSLTVTGWDSVLVYNAEITRGGQCERSSGERHACQHCATALWLYDPRWPDLLHPFASAIDTDLPRPPASVHIMLSDRPDWATVPDVSQDLYFESYPEQSLEDWHKEKGLWVA